MMQEASHDEEAWLNDSSKVAKMALVLGEDSESDEEINTEQLTGLVLTPDGSISGYQGLMKSSLQQKTAGVVMGEDCETDDEEEENVAAKEGSEDKSDSGSFQVESGSTSSQQDNKEESLEPPIAIPPSLLHKKLRERNQSLRRNIVERIMKLYSITCRNLTLVNNNLSKAQGTIETVNSNLKRSEHDLSDLNSILRDINQDARLLAPYLNTENLTLPKKTPPSPITHKLLKGFSAWGAAAGAMTASKPTTTGANIPEARPGGSRDVQPSESTANKDS